MFTSYPYRRDHIKPDQLRRYQYPWKIHIEQLYINHTIYQAVEHYPRPFRFHLEFLLLLSVILIELGVGRTCAIPSRPPFTSSAVLLRVEFISIWAGANFRGHPTRCASLLFSLETFKPFLDSFYQITNFTKMRFQTLSMLWRILSIFSSLLSPNLS